MKITLKALFASLLLVGFVSAECEKCGKGGQKHEENEEAIVECGECGGGCKKHDGEEQEEEEALLAA